jgi:hypothetical protein
MGLGKTYSTKYLLDSNNNRGAEGQVLSTTSTGIDWVDANTVPGSGLWLASGNNIYNSNSGNVGIGMTTAPNYKLEVTGSGYFNGQLIVKSQGVGNSISIIESSTGNLAAYMGESAIGHGFLALFEKSVGEVIRFDANSNSFINRGNVGIGTTSPGSRLEVYGTDGLRTHFNEGLRVTRETVPTQYGMVNYNAGALNMIAVNTAGTGSVTKFMRSGNGTSLDTSMVIDTSGNVGIGTTSPAGRLEIKTGSSYTGHTQPNIKLINFGYRDAELNVFTEGSYFTHYFENYSGGNGRYYDRSLEIVCKGSPDGTYGEGVIKFKANPITAGSNVAEIMRITGAGKVGIGTISPSKKLEVAGSYKLGTNAYIEYGASYPYTITTANTAAVGNLVFSAGLGSNAYESRIDLQGTNTAGAAGITLSTAATARMSITSGGDIQIPTNSASLQLRSSGSSSYTSIRRDSANQLIVANTAGNQVFGIGNGGELRINNGASYSAQYTYTSGWNSSMQTLIPGSSLSPNAVYLVTIKCNSFGAPPYYASTVFHIATSPGTNGTGGSVPFNPPTATHVSSNAVWIIRISTIVSGRNGLEGYLSGGPTNFNGATIYVKATKIMTM